MPDGWKPITRGGRGHASWVNYEHGVEIRVRPISGGRFEVALLNAARYGPGKASEPIDLYVAIERTMEAAARRVKWIKENVERLLSGERVEVERS